MYLLKPLNIFIIYMLIVNPVFARNVYIVKNGDILSTIVLKNTAPPLPLYGKWTSPREVDTFLGSFNF